MKQKDIVKTFTFSQQERERLQNIEIGLINAEATLTGLSIYKNGFLQNVYKRVGIDKDPQKGYTKDIRYSLTPNMITYTETPVKKNVKE